MDAPTEKTPNPFTRVAYIRTIPDKRPAEEIIECQLSNLRTWLRFWVGQKVPYDPCGAGRKNRTSPPPGLRHHYILGYTTAADAVILDWLLEASTPGSDKLSRTDFELFLSEAQMKDVKNKDLIRRLEAENVIVTKITTPSSEYASDDICDSVMLSKSDYVLDTTLQYGPSDWISTDALYRDSLRHAHPQYYKTDELNNFYFESRLKNKMGHTQRSCSYPHGKSEAWLYDHYVKWQAYACPSCGQRCKRSKGCKNTGEDWGKDRRREEWMEGVDLDAPRPPEFERDWRMLSVENVLNYYSEDRLAWERFRKWKWRSIDTFSGDWKRE
ncbi:hypothetical protein NW768_002610 [Fusarium equiseti]|uniref:Uncharacterized protein n=1 Tax=Fusarium equiseti TaxID=61235 RepID=A0ABQ8RP94_FUSEQ|nr:hypothetical protein NW768_002610 [Fusarium equiseti]